MFHSIKFETQSDNTATATITFGGSTVATTPVPASLVKEIEDGMVVFQKEDGTWLWLAVFTNSFQDGHGEWMIADSHREYVRAVNEGQVDYPELWLWHEPLWKLGKADVIVDDVIDETTVFVLAAGHFDPDKVWIAPILASVPLGNSHQGVGIKAGDTFLAYAPFEITALPPTEAANKLTAFTSWQKENDPMTIQAAKRDKMAEFLGVNPEELEELERKNEQTAAAAKQLGMISKAATPDAVEEDVVKEDNTADIPTEAPVAEIHDVVTDAVGDDAVGDDPVEALRKELTEVLSLMTQQIISFSEQTGEIFKALKTQGEALEALQANVTGLQKEAGLGDQNTLAQMIFKHLGSAPVPDSALETPAETPAANKVRRITGDGWIDSLLAGQEMTK